MWEMGIHMVCVSIGWDTCIGEMRVHMVCVSIGWDTCVGEMRVYTCWCVSMTKEGLTVMYFNMSVSEISAKLSAEQLAKQEAVERCEKSEHQCSMLQLDLKNAHDEISILKTEMQMTVAKVREYYSMVCI